MYLDILIIEYCMFLEVIEATLYASVVKTAANLF
jgi:hypothetical protein